MNKLISLLLESIDYSNHKNGCGIHYKGEDDSCDCGLITLRDCIADIDFLKEIDFAGLSEIEILEKEFDELERQKQNIIEKICNLRNKESEKKREQYLKQKENDSEWWDKFDETVVSKLKPGMIVKFKGTRDGLGYRKIESIIEHAYHGNANFAIIGKKVYLQRRSRFDAQNRKIVEFEVTHESTENGIEKLTHVVISPNEKIPIKEWIEKNHV